MTEYILFHNVNIPSHHTIRRFMYGRSNQLEKLRKSLISSSSHSPWVKCCLSMEMFKERLDLEGHQGEGLWDLGPCWVTELSGHLFSKDTWAHAGFRHVCVERM